MRLKRVSLNPGSWILGVHYGRNPVSGQRFMCVAVAPMLTIDFEFKPYVNDEAKRQLEERRSPMPASRQTVGAARPRRRGQRGV